MKQRILSLLLALCMVMTAMAAYPITVTAATQGIYTYTISGNKATITSCSNTVTGKRVIPSFLGGKQVVAIGDYAFYGCAGLTSVTIPNTVTGIGEGAFYGCTGLPSITIPNKVTTIEKGTFYNCSGLTNVTIPDGVTRIGDHAFGYCSSLTNITIPASITTIGEFAFYNCSSLTNVTIPTSVTTIGDYAFRDCSGLTNITIPNSVTTIGEGAFVYCNLTDVTIPDSVTTVGGYAFFGCDRLTNLTIPDSVTTIGICAFEDCSSLTSVTIPDSVTTIGNSAFSGCDSLTDVYYTGTEEQWNLISIGSYNTALTNATIHCQQPEEPAGIQYQCGANVTAALDDDGTLTIRGTGAMYDYSTSGNVPWYKERGGVKKVVIESGVTTIGDYAFYYCDSLTNVTIPDSVTTIGDYAFEACESLTSITIPDSVTTIGDYVFEFCYSLTNVTIPDSVTTIGDGAFYYCRSLTSVTIPDSVTTIGNWAFEACDSLTSVTIGNSVTTIGDGAFSWCYSLTNVTIPDSVTTIGDRAFLRCYSLTNVTIPDSVTSIGEGAFYNCSSLTNVTIPDSVTTIEREAFRYCNSLTNITIPDSVTTIGRLAFSSCDSLTDVTIGDSVTTIGDRAFSSCDSLTAINVSSGNINFISVDGVLFNKAKTTLVEYPEGKTNTTYIVPDSVTTIGDAAFYGCYSLADITIPDSVTTIGYAAFEDCDSLTDVYYAGTKEQWNRISIGLYNTCLTNANIHYNYKKPMGLALSSDAITAIPKTCQSIFVYKADGVTPYPKSVKVESDDKKIVTTSRKGNEIILEFHSVGSATITVSATDGSGMKATCKVTVKKYTPQDIDLLERLALCQLVYSCNERETDGGHKAYDLVVEQKVGDAQQKANKKGEMFYLSNNNIISYDAFYQQYIHDYTVLMLPENPTMGFYAAAFESPEGDIVIAYRGSEGDYDSPFLSILSGLWEEESEVDWWDSDLGMFFGQLSSQFPQALEFYDDVKEAYPGKKITVTGHSLGGALSSYVASNRNVRCDNINGATGFIYNRDVLANPNHYMVNFEGFDKYVFENFNGHDDSGNNTVTKSRNFGSFNYNEYADSTTKNEKNDDEFTFDYHAISSILQYDNGKILLTEKTKEYSAEPEIRYGLRFIGTSKSDTYIAPIAKKNYPASLPGGNQSSYRELPVAPARHYVLAGDGDDTITLPEGGDDTLIGNGGNDTLNGGAGSDIYVYGGNFGNDTIIDPSGKDKIIFTDVSLSDISISGNTITCGTDSITISKKSRRMDSFTVVDKNNNTQTIPFAVARVMSLRAVAPDTTKGIQVFGNATVEIYDAEETLIDTLIINEETAENVLYNDYGMAMVSAGVLGLTLPPDGYIVKVKSDDTVSVWAVSDADAPAVAKQTFVEQRDLSDGSILIINTGELTEEQLSVKLVNADGEENIHSEVPKPFAITADKTAIKTGEAVTLCVPEAFADSVVWECVDSHAYIVKNEDGSVRAIGYTAGEETVRAYLPNDESYSAEISFTITQDAEPNVVITCQEEEYDGTFIATDSVFFDVVPVDAYDTIVFDSSSPYSPIEDTNSFVVNSVGEHTIYIYCENSQTGARTDIFSFTFRQDSKAPEILGAVNDEVYYTDRVIEVSDVSLDTVSLNGELIEQDTMILGEVGTYTITATDTAGNVSEISFVIEELPSVTDICQAKGEMVSKIRNDFEEIKYSLSEERMNLLEGKIFLLEEVLYTKPEITEVTYQTNGSTASIHVSAVNLPEDAILYVASYTILGQLLEIQTPVVTNGTADATFASDGVHYYKAFLWDGHYSPYAMAKSCNVR